MNLQHSQPSNVKQQIQKATQLQIETIYQRES